MCHALSYPQRPPRMPMRKLRALAPLSVFLVLASACESQDNGIGGTELLDANIEAPGTADHGAVFRQADVRTPGHEEKPDVLSPGADAPADAGAGEESDPSSTLPDPCGGSDRPEGCPCQGPDDCGTGWCVEARAGRICAAPCVDECEEGSVCALVEGEGPDVGSACVPMHARLCHPCGAHEDCRAAQGGPRSWCLELGAEGSFCGSPCQPGEKSCPEGFSCEAVLPKGELEEAGQCVPEGGVCDCPASAVGLETECAAPTEQGYCPGTRSCTESGLGECEVATTSLEECRPVCTDPLCEGRACEEVREGWCLIDGGCFPEGAYHPLDDCLLCASEQSVTEWSPIGAGPCDDGDPCTAEDRCGDGGCSGTAYVCDDDLECTTGSCTGDGGCEWEVVAGMCAVGLECVEAGAGSETNPCLVCRPEVDAKAWSSRDGEACDDGDPCTAGDSCGPEGCAGALYSCDDGLGCTTDSCDGDGGCDREVEAGWCAIGSDCVEAEAIDPADSCLACRPEIDSGAWTSREGESCDDGDPCTSGDSCEPGEGCTGTAYSCEDELECTTDSCAGDGTCRQEVEAGWCVVDGACYAEGALKPDEPCLACLPELSTTRWSLRKGEGCDDGDPCTAADNCGESGCTGTPYTCEDELPCTTGSCDGAGGCEQAVAPGMCAVGTGCVQAGDLDGANPCLACRPELDAKAWSLRNGEVCDDGDPCTSGDACGAQGCAGSPYSCDDGVECTFDSCTGDGGCDHEAAPGVCAIGTECVQAGALNIADSCLACRPEVDSRAWTLRVSETCDDGDPCTSSDSCEGTGDCSGTAYSCDDGLGCTVDSCTGDGGCGNAVEEGWCVIDGACHSAEALKPDDPCLACRPALSTAAWSSRSGEECDDGDPCTAGDLCRAAGCSGTPYVCEDSLECTTGECTGDGGCDWKVAPGKCVVGAQCIDAGTRHPIDTCKACIPEVESTGWSLRAGEACDDGDLCTLGDACRAEGCLGSSYSCDDGLDCTQDSCTGDGGCLFADASGACVYLGVCFYGESCDDDDGDGTPNGVDCAPDDPTVGHDAYEVCNDRDDDCDGSVDEGLGCTEGGTGTSEEDPGLDCAHIKARYDGSEDGVYWLQPESAGRPFRSYCDMSTDGGGWTLVMKVDGEENTFRYTSAFWEDEEVYAEHLSGLDDGEAKLRGFFTVPLFEIRLGIRLGEETRWGTIPRQAHSLREVFASPKNTYTLMGKEFWASLGAWTGDACNREGVNNQNPRDSYWRTRLGWISAKTDCNYEANVFGVGLDGSLGMSAGQYGSNIYAGETRAGFAWIFVRQRVASEGYPGTRANPARTCKEILDEMPWAWDGIYWLDPENAPAPFRALCDMRTGGGGWTLLASYTTDLKLRDYDPSKAQVQTSHIGENANDPPEIWEPEVFGHVDHTLFEVNARELALECRHVDHLTWHRESRRDLVASWPPGDKGSYGDLNGWGIIARNGGYGRTQWSVCGSILHENGSPIGGIGYCRGGDSGGPAHAASVGFTIDHESHDVTWIGCDGSSLQDKGRFRAWIR